MAEQQEFAIRLSSTDNGEGLLLTDSGGNYYYIRPDILAQTKMTDEEILRVKAQGPKGQDRELSADELQAVAGGTSQPPGIINIGHVPTLSSGVKMEGTIMCPW